MLLDAQRPVLLNGIEAVLTRGDAIDRAIVIELIPIADDDRRTEAEIAAEFEAIRPAVLGVLLDAACMALRNWPVTKLERLPRMADFAQWVEAGAPAFGWQAGSFLAVYTHNRGEADEIALDALPTGAAVRAFKADKTAWEGTASELLDLLAERAGGAARDRSWPKRAHVLSGQLKRLAPNFRRLGIAVETSIKESGGKRRLIRLRTSDPNIAGSERPKRPERPSPHDGANADRPRASQTGSGASQIEGRASQPYLEHPRDDAESASERDAWDAWERYSFVPWDDDAGNESDSRASG